MLPCAIKCATCGSIFDPARIRRELSEIETRLADPALWSDPAASQPLMRDRKRLESLVANDEGLVRRTGDIEAYFELAGEGEDVLADLERDVKALATFADDLEAKTMLSGEADPLNAIVTVHPGAGGTESQDWAEMLLRMYLRWAEQQGFKTEMNDYQDGEEAGIKSATFTITGEYAGVRCRSRRETFIDRSSISSQSAATILSPGSKSNSTSSSSKTRKCHRKMPASRVNRRRSACSRTAISI